MGDVAEDYVDGSCCSGCGQYFKGSKEDVIHTHGYPVLCKQCWDAQPKNERKRKVNSIGLQRSLAETL
jgi:hypothetical protein